MGRKREYYKWQIPGSVVAIVESLCADYERRKAVISMGGAEETVLAEYRRLNDIIDAALEDVEQGVRKYMLCDVANHSGYVLSQASLFFAKNTYYARKRKLVHDIAAGLKLIE